MKKIICVFVVVTIALLACQVGLAGEKLTAQDWLQRGMEFEKQKIYDEAIKMFTRAIEADRANAKAYLQRAKAYMASHKTNAMEALPDFNKAIDLDPTNAEAYYERGLLHSFILNNENARDDMKTAASLGHKGAETWLAPVAEDKDKGKKDAGMGRAAVASREETPPLSTAGTEDNTKEQEAKHSGLGQYLSSRSEPMILFDLNRSAIKREYHVILDEIALVLKEKMPDADIVLAGYTDNTGTEQYNDRLSLQRAKAVESYLTMKHGISPERIRVKGYGQSDPIATNETEEGQATNRRVEVRIGTKGEAAPR